MPDNVVKFISTFFLFIIFTANVSSQEIVFVEGDTKGQGVTRKLSGQYEYCYVITPKHVVGYAYDVQVVDRRRIKTNGIIENTYPSDIAIVKFKDTGLCKEEWPSSYWMKDSLEDIEKAVIVSRLEDGTKTRKLVLINKFTDIWILVKPYDNADTIFKGMSGSLLQSEGKILGQVIKVKDGVGHVLRQDYIDAVLKNKFGEASYNIVAVNKDENLLSGNWVSFGEAVSKQNLKISKNKITLRYSGKGDGSVNLGVKQEILIQDLRQLKLSFDARATASIDDESYVIISIDIFDSKGKKVQTLYSSPDSYMEASPPALFIKWHQGKSIWDIEELMKDTPTKPISKIIVSLKIKTLETEGCRACKLMLNNIKLYY
ncbi:MAG: hypothetical protein COA93_10685 [Alphaproteobacteria bacterium]|nr:MAG: hypothetical protein COA93_10685 [Alphaproteobacteria bacterium]